MKESKLWGIIIAIVVFVSVCFGFYYLGFKNTGSSNEKSYYDNIVDNTDKIVSITPSEDSKYNDETVIKLTLNPASIKYGLGMYKNGESEEEIFPNDLGGFYHKEHASSSFLTIEHGPGEAGESSWSYFRLSTRVGRYIDDVLVEKYDASIVFGFEVTTSNELKLIYSFSTYGNQGFVPGFVQSYVGKIYTTNVRCPYVLTSDYQGVCSLLSSSGYMTEDSVWKVLTENNEVISFKDDVLQSVSRITKYFINYYNNKGSAVYTSQFDFTDYLQVETAEDYDYLLCNFKFVNICSEFTYTDIFVNSNIVGDTVWSLFNNENTAINIPLVSVVC